MSLDKNFNMTYNEHHQLQIRFDAFNAFNHTNFGNPNTFLDGTSTPAESRVPMRLQEAPMEVRANCS